MKSGSFHIVGEKPTVQVLNAQQRALEKKTKAALEGRTVDAVLLYGDQLVLKLDDGTEFIMACNGGFVETN